MRNCSRLYFLSTLACKLAECLSESELNKLSSDLDVLSDMLTHLIVHKDSDECDISCPKTDARCNCD